MTLSTLSIVEPTLLIDFYKLGHRPQYPKNTQRVYSTWIPRGSRIEGVTKVSAVGFQGFVKQYLIDYFNVNFFQRPKHEVVAEYRRFVKFTLGVENPEVQHIEDLHDLGYIPLKIKAVKEGTLIPLRVPMVTMENTDDRFFWFTNYIETLFSVTTWMPSTSSTIAGEYYKILHKYAMETVGNIDHVQWQLHDFSMRGMGGLDSALTSGFGHLTAFTGTDTAGAISYIEKYYNANIENELVGGSVNATEHSVMCAHGQDEVASYRYLMEEAHPEGILSIVSDTWDLWNVLTNVLPQLKELIMNRNGKIVIRPDSGDPVKILCGNPEGKSEAEILGVIQLLWNTFGGTVNELGYKVLDPHIGAIYGDAITRERAEAILSQLKEKGFASSNIVFGVGSFTYQYNTRDTFMFAIKATDVTINGVEKAIFKDPITDDGTKRSLTGRVVVLEQDGEIIVKDGLTIDEQLSYEKEDLLETVFVNGKLIRDERFADIRARYLSQLV